MNNLTFLPIALPFLAFILSLLSYYYTSLQKYISLAVSVFYIAFAYWALSGPAYENSLQLSAGGWAPQFGISLAIDGFTAIMLFVTGIIYFATVLYSELGTTAEDSRLYFPLLNILLTGISGAFVTADLFNLYVWFEVTLLSSFVLMSLGKDKARLTGSIKYVMLNILSSMIFLIAAGLIYAITHTLNFADLSERLISLKSSDAAYIETVSLLLFSAFAIKSAIFPFYSWLPASYHLASPALSGLFAGMLTKVGLYAIFRVSTLVFPASPYLTQVILVLAPITMITGVFGAIIQTQIRRILSFHIISQVGYIALAGAFVASDDASLRAAGLAAGIFYIVHHIVVKTNLFFIAGLIQQFAGSESLKKLGGLRVKFPLLAIIFAIPAMSLAGLPPSSGFWAKLALFKTALSAEHYLATLAMIVAGFFTLFSMVKIWNGAFWSEPIIANMGAQKKPLKPLLACLILATVSIGFALAPDFLMSHAKHAAEGATTQQYVGANP